MKHIPNLITSVRLVAALVLALLSITTGPLAIRFFLLLFCAAGISDMLDGFVARRFNWCTEFGARLDSVSDLLLYLSVALFLALHAGKYLAPCTPLLVAGLAIQLFHWALAQSRHGAYSSYHSTFSRVCAYMMFFGTLAFWIFKLPLMLSGMILAWIACSCEGILITMLLDKAVTDVSGIGAALSLRRSFLAASIASVATPRSETNCRRSDTTA